MENEKIRRVDRCYISGKIGGLRYLEAVANFREGEDFVKKEMHLVPVNPLLNGLETSAPWFMHIMVDLWMMLHCAHVLFLSNAAESRGAKIEYWVASLFNMDMWFLSGRNCMVADGNEAQLDNSENIKRSLADKASNSVNKTPSSVDK